jgi:hypothetical protein|uniref:Uncharacterized protein n=1 Tax=viral metagenome TaxID=1070528 RepID=A0A6C0CUB5_9ZZZZ
MDIRKLYNHDVWPSPRAVISCRNLGLIRKEPPKDSIGRIKKMTHMEGLELLAKKAKMPLENFLKLSRCEALEKLGCRKPCPHGGYTLYDPLYVSFKYL